MLKHHAFELLQEQTIPEVNSLARLYRHKKTGAEVLSLINDDENKVFGVTLKTPPSDSTGVAHILEHSVLCGSRKYPVRKPFVEMLKGSLHTFLNAMTFPDKTAYPVASQNLRDFYNLVDVYLDAVFHPLISEDTFKQEGWHYELDGGNAPLIYKGVVFNEMKGVYSSPEAVLRDVSQRSIYPDNAYGVSSGGDPKVIPELTYEDFKAFHERFYHPSNTRAFFYGDDDPEERLNILDAVFSEFDKAAVTSQVSPQPRFAEPRRVERTYASGEPQPGKRTGMVTVNWMLDEIVDPKARLALDVLEHVLVGTSAAPLRKAMTDSGLGESFAGGGFSDDYLQPFATFGLKGIADADLAKVEPMILDNLKTLAEGGIDPLQIEASLNTIEFALRENNTGSLPRGISLMLRSMRTWLHGHDPLTPLAFEEAFTSLKQDLAAGRPIFEDMIKTLLLENQHRTTVILTADPGQGQREARQEEERLAGHRAELDHAGIEAAIAETHELKTLQEAIDAPEALAKLPALQLADLPREGKVIPTEEERVADTRVLTHDLATNGILYLDLAFDMSVLPADLLPYMPIFSRALLQTGTKDQDFVSLSQRIGRSTGGIAPGQVISSRVDGGTAAYLVMRGKAVPDKVSEMLAIMADIIHTARLDNHERIKQMVLENKAGFEGRLAGAGSGLMSSRISAALREADWASEQMGGITQLFFLRKLVDEVQNDWPAVQAKLERIRELLFARASAIANITADAAIWQGARPELEAFLKGLPVSTGSTGAWSPLLTPRNEAFTFPGQVNYVAKGANLFDLGYSHSGSIAVVLRHTQTTYLWDKVRVLGGAYGSSIGYDFLTGSLAFSSYRDPNLLGTLAVYDNTPSFLRQAIGETELTRSIIGTIGTIDRYMLPDAKGYSAMVRVMTGDTDEARQTRREQVLGTTAKDFRAMADLLEVVAREGHVAVLGSEAAIGAANAERGGFMTVTRVL
ncbi:peptidase M16 [Youhaiella tibetensis]|uniref:Peptidase M16 n=1 Tax=Paradevosia tibetensis TaxID=1447062 RepID=A0A5B9DST7_9HYPH|nr:insulinase family protein [Youhaiella tibetensis]QEE22005.1 peptidase M16 [Youhaiella tibetensis]GGF46210.1 peptidase M16 [Youhaiella tibetensis]